MSDKARKLETTRIIFDEPEPVEIKKGPQPFFNLWRLGFLGVLLAAILVYLPSLHGLKVWDDDALLDGSGIGGGTSLWSSLTEPFLGSYFRPLVSLSFFIENKIWHGTPLYYHQTNILLHVLACAALIGLVYTAFNDRKLALLSGLLFAIQPAQVSTVAWIGGRTDSMATLFVVLFAYTLLLAIRGEGKTRTWWIAASVFAFFCACLTKEQLVALVVLVPLMLQAFGKGQDQKNPRRAIKLTAPYVLAVIAFAVLWMADYPTPFTPVVRTFAEQVMLLGQTIVYYALLFLAPSGKWMHTLSLGTMKSAGVPLACAGITLFVFLAYGTFYLTKKNPKLACFAWIAGLAMLPVSNIIPLPSLLVAPYRAGVAGLGVAVLLAWLLCNVPARTFAIAVGTLFVGWCAGLCYWGSLQWMNPVTIFSRITAEDPGSIIARRNMSSYLLKSGESEKVTNSQKAIDQMTQILAMLYGSSAWQQPDSAYDQFSTDPELVRRIQENQGNEVKPELWLGELFAQLGYAQGNIKDYEDSRKSFATSVRIDPSNPRANMGLAQFAFFDKKYDVAVSDLRIAIATHPSDPAIHGLLGQAYEQQGKYKLAATSYRNAIRIEPWFAPPYQFLAEVQVKEGDKEGAIATLKSALNCRVLDADGIKKRIAELESAK